MSTSYNRARWAIGRSTPYVEIGPLPIVSQRAPTTNDRCEIGTMWIDEPNDDVYVITSASGGTSVWINAGGGTGTFNALTVTTTATIGTALTLTTGNLTLGDMTTAGVLSNTAAGVIQSSTGTDGQLFISATGAAPAWATVASGDGSVTITGGANTLDLRVSGATASTFPCDGGTATPALGATTLAGGTNITTAGAGSTATFNLDAAPTLAGLLTCQLGIDVSGATAVLTAATDAADTIYLHADAGTAETIRLHSDQGTGVGSVTLESDVGGITVLSGLASDDAINLTATNGGIDVDAAMQINIASSENATDAIVINSAAGGIDITSAGAAGEDIDITASSSINLVSNEDAAQSIYLHADGGTNETIDIYSDQGTGAASVYIHSDVGGVTIDSTLASADAINIGASDAAGGIDIDSGTGGFDVLTTGAISLDASLGSNLTVTGAVDLTLQSTAGGVDIDGGEAAADAISLNASDGAGGVTIAAGTGGLLFGNQADCTTIDLGDFAPTATRTITIGGGTVVTAAVTDTIDIGPDGATTNANSIKTVNINTGGVTLGEVLTHIATGAITSGTHTVNIQSGNAAAGTVATNVSTGTGTKTVNVGNADGLTTVNIDAITLINDSLNVNTSINTGTSTGAVAIGNAAAGAMTIDTAAGISLDAATASNFTVTGAADLTLQSTLGGVDLISGLAAADAIVINASDAAGGVDLDCGTAGFIVTIADGPLTVVTGTGQVDISADATANTVNIATGAGIKTLTMGSDNTTSITTIDCGTAGMALGTTANAHTTTIGSATGAASIVCQSGTGAAEFGINATDHTTTLGSVTGTSATTVRAGTGALTCTAGGAFDVNAVGNVTIDSTGGTLGLGEGADAQNINIGTGAAARVITIGNATGATDVSINSGTGDITLTSTDDITLDATSGDLSLDGATVDLNATGGALSATPATGSVAGVALTLNARLGVCEFTGQTTGAGADLDLDITNSFMSAGVGVLVTVGNEGTNDADITIEGVNTQTAGHLILHCINSGPAALNGDVTVTFWIIN